MACGAASRDVHGPAEANPLLAVYPRERHLLVALLLGRSESVRHRDEVVEAHVGVQLDQGDDLEHLLLLGLVVAPAQGPDEVAACSVQVDGVRPGIEDGPLQFEQVPALDFALHAEERVAALDVERGGAGLGSQLLGRWPRGKLLLLALGWAQGTRRED